MGYERNQSPWGATVKAYYNEFDPKACVWLRELIKDGLIMDGDVDDRSIEDVQPGDLRGYTRCHFFAGIGGWDLALQIAGWPDEQPVWTGSVPCQPFSTAGKGLGHADERHMWPYFCNLVQECRPDAIFGEQVEGAIKKGWLDGVQRDLEGEGYAVGHCVLGAHSVGAPHIRQRLYWAADNRRESGTINVADTSIEGSQRRVRGRQDATREDQHGHAGCSSEPVGVADPRGYWGDSAFVFCRDEKHRRIPTAAQPIFQRMVDGVPTDLAECDPRDGFPLAVGVKNRAVMLRGIGNAIVPQCAAEFVRAFMETKARGE